MRIAIIAALAVLLAGCAVQRAMEAQDARAALVGMTPGQVLACMGAPGNKTAEGSTEVWAYASGDGYVGTSSFGSSNTTANVSGGPGYAYGNANTLASGLSVTRRRYCTVNVVMEGGLVSRVNYNGPTGGLVTPGEQCAYAVQNCLQH